MSEASCFLEAKLFMVEMGAKEARTKFLTVKLPQL